MLVNISNDRVINTDYMAVIQPHYLTQSEILYGKETTYQLVFAHAQWTIQINENDRQLILDAMRDKIYKYNEQTSGHMRRDEGDAGSG